MSQPRVVMIWAGALFAVGGLVLIVLRLIGAHDGLPLAAGLAPLQYFGAASGLGVVGLGLVLTAPKDRRKTRRVRLDKAPVQENTTLRPGRQHGIPTTSGFQHDSEVRPVTAPKPSAPSAPAPSAPAAPDAATAAPSSQRSATAAPSSQRSATADPLPATTGVPATPEAGARSSWGKPRMTEPDQAPMRGHPNSATLEPPARQAAPSGPQQTSAPREGHATGARATIPGFDDHDAAARQQSRRIELMSRLEELEQKANQAKVRYGLGKVSAAGYRQYLAEVDRERMMIESELMESEE